MTNRGTTAIRWAAAGVGVVAMMWMPGLVAADAEGQPPRPPAAPLMTAWAQQVRVKPSFFEGAYPDLRMWRGEGDLLDGLWDLAITDAAQAAPPSRYDGKIVVPFPVESALSRVMKPLGPGRRMWYRRTFDSTKNWRFPGRRVLLHFNGVAGEAVVWVNGQQVGRHAGPWDEFAFDITDALVQQGQGVQEVVVAVLGPAGGSDAARPAGVGIWRTIWLEPVHGDRIVSLASAGDADAGVLRVTAQCTGQLADCTVRAVALDRGSEVARDEGKPGQTLTLPIRAGRLWSPDRPILYDLRVTLLHGKQTLDRVESFFAMRTVAVGDDGQGVRRVLLNGKPLFQCGVADAGRWPDGLCTPPTDSAVRREIERIKQLGFNMVRKRGKVESDYWYYLCDRLGLLVWQDLPVASGPAGQEQAGRIIAARANHPSIVAWVIDGGGRDRADLARLAAGVKRADPTRPVWVANVPPDAGLGDVVDRRTLAAAAGTPGHDARADVFVVGRSARAVAGHTWTPVEPGREGASAGQFTADFLKDATRAADLRDAHGLAGAILGEWTDDETGRTGLLTYDRAVVKADPERLASAAGGAKGVLSPRIRVVLATARAGGQGWRYAPKEASGWPTAEFDDAAWPTGVGGFGTKASAGGDAVVRTDWAGGELFLRRPFTLDLAKLRDACLLLRAAGEVEVFFNGRMAMRVQGRPGGYLQLPLDEGALEALRPGPNVLALRCRPPKDAPPLVDAGLIEFLPQRDAQLPARLAHWPLLDVFMRDTCICVGSDGTYYLTGTAGNWGGEGIRIWKSKDLAHWDDLGLVWTPEKNATWQLRNRPRKGFCLWAPELHYMKGTFWITYCVSYPPTENGAHGTGLLKSTGGQAAGPYLDTHPEGPMSPGLDATLFEDDDGKVYFLWGGNSIVRMKDDMSGFAEKPRNVGPDEGGTVGYEGIFLFKAHGRYYLSATANGLPERDYDCMVAVGDNPYGPFHGRYKAVAHGGHNMFFKDAAGRWWCTMFGGGPRAPFIHRPGILRVEFAADGMVRPLLDAGWR